MELICDSCGQPMDPNVPGLRRCVTDADGAVIGQWQWHIDCEPAGPSSPYDFVDGGEKPRARRWVWWAVALGLVAVAFGLILYSVNLWRAGT